MATSWADILDLGEREPPGGAGEPSDDGERRGVFRRVRESLSRTREALGAEIASSVVEGLEHGEWEQLEEALILADVGAPATAKVVAELEQEVTAGRLSGAEDVRGRLTELLAEMARTDRPRLALDGRPAVVMVVGVNGTGKTTTIGKLAHQLSRQAGLDVLLAAGDTYRAAAVEQLERWADQVGCEIVRADEGSDSGAVIYDSLDAAEARGKDVVIVDTAGRLHTRGDLMEELSKVRRVIGKRIEGAPHETLLVIDATTGQNGLRQARLFAEAVDVTGVVLTKLDGTARGGIALAIADELGIPVKLVGTGETLDDLRPFDAREFAGALFAE